MYRENCFEKGKTHHRKSGCGRRGGKGPHGRGRFRLDSIHPGGEGLSGNDFFFDEAKVDFQLENQKTDGYDGTAAGSCPLCRKHCSLRDPGCPKGMAFAASRSR